MIAGFNCGTRINALAAFTGRAGIAFNRALVYAKGGVAWDSQTDMFNNVGAMLFTLGIDGTPLTSKSSNWGYTVGAGVEYALISNWSAALEYNYYDFGKSAAFTTDDPAGPGKRQPRAERHHDPRDGAAPELQVRPDGVRREIVPVSAPLRCDRSHDERFRNW